MTEQTNVHITTDVTYIQIVDKDVTAISSGTTGPRGLPGTIFWVVLTQAEYDALENPDPNILYATY